MNRRTLIIHVFILTGVSILAGILTVDGARATESSFELALDSIQSGDLTYHGRFLSSDELEGRNGGSEGEAIAALYLASEFRKLGLLPGGSDGTYFQQLKARRGKTTYNVLGLLPGADADLRHEIVVVGGHYDHIGLNRQGEICNGADDNASGTAAVIEVAEAFLMDPPRRSVLFMGFAAEEQGLLGSKHYCEHPIHPLKNTVAMINLDMIGRSKDDYLFIGGAGTSPMFRPLIERLNDRFGFDLEVKDGGGAPSDNMSFFLRGVPVLFLFTGTHPDYNQPSDDWDRVNVDGLEKIARLAFSLAHHVANENERPEFVRESGFALPDRMMEEMRQRRGNRQGGGDRPRRAYLGINLGPGDEEIDGVRVSTVVEDGPAAKGGLVPEDVIVRIGDDDVETIEDLLSALQSRKPDQSVTVVVERDGRRRELEVKLGGR